MDFGTMFLIVAVLVALHFAPSLTAYARRHRNRGAIFALNLFLGWTLLGWVAALVWSLTDYVEPPKPPVADRSNESGRPHTLKDVVIIAGFLAIAVIAAFIIS
jgi:hypothetical protein